MASFLDRGFRFLCAAQAGAQLFFIAAAQVIFSPEVAALAHENPRRILAADLVGQLLVRLDAAALIIAAAALGLGLLDSRRRKIASRRTLGPLLAGLCAVASMAGTTPAIQALRAANRTGEPLFGALHALSSLLLLLEILLFAWAALGSAGDASGAPNAPAPALDGTGTSR